nr:unnamed protein product [Callosobruchus chinensis]CAI5867375.1 unnamed protein product [Callosobruchus analis]
MRSERARRAPRYPDSLYHS